MLHNGTDICLQGRSQLKRTPMNTLQLPNHLTCIVFGLWEEAGKNPSALCNFLAQLPSNRIELILNHQNRNRNWPQLVADWSGHFLTRLKISTIDGSVSGSKALTEFDLTLAVIYERRKILLSFPLSSRWREVTSSLLAGRPQTSRPIVSSCDRQADFPQNNTRISECYSAMRTGLH